MQTIESIEAFERGFRENNYVVDYELATIVFLMYKLQRPLLVEGPAGVGKTELAYAIADTLSCEFLRLQCYEGLDINAAVYEWNYQKQLLAIKIQEQSDKSEEEKERYIFSKEFLLERPLLQSISKDESPVLLIDEIDRSDEEFEAYLLELLSVYQISIPELGTVKAKKIPIVVLTSNRTRELSDALKRRCLYYWLDYPSMEKELEIVQQKLPEINEQLQQQVVQFVQSLRNMHLEKTPGVAETLDWAVSLFTIGKSHLDQQAVKSTIGCLLKSTDDIDKLVHSELFTQQISS